MLHLPSEMGKEQEKPIDVDETLNPKMGGFVTMMHDADSFVLPCCVLPSPLPTVVGAVRMSLVTAAVPATDLTGIAVAGNLATIALAKNAKRPQFTGNREKPRLGFLQEGLVQVCATIGWKSSDC